MLFAISISILLAAWMLVLAITYALLMQMILCRICGFTLVRRRRRDFFFWNSLAFAFKVIMPFSLLLILLPLVLFCCWRLAYSYDSRDLVVALVLLYLSSLLTLWLNKGAKSMQRSFEADYQQNKFSPQWWCIMSLTWLLAFPLSQFSIAPVLGGNKHMYSHNVCSGTSRIDNGDPDCLICWYDEHFCDVHWHQAQPVRIQHAETSVPSYNVMWYPTWMLDKLTCGHAHAVIHAVMLVISIGAMAVILVLVHILLLRKRCKMSTLAALCVIAIVAGGSLLFIFWGREESIVVIHSESGETYEQYLKRVKIDYQHYCPNCVIPLFHCNKHDRSNEYHDAYSTHIRREKHIRGNEHWYCYRCDWGRCNSDYDGGDFIRGPGDKFGDDEFRIRW